MKYEIDGLKILAQNAEAIGGDINSLWSFSSGVLPDQIRGKYIASLYKPKIIVWHKEACRLSKILDKEAYQDFIGPKTEQDYWGSLVIEDIFRSKEKAEIFIEFLETKRFLLNKIIAAHESSKYKNDVSASINAEEIDEISQKLPLYIKPDIGIFSRENSKIPFFPIKINRNYVFLEGCIVLCDSEFKVAGAELFKYLVKNKARLPKHKPGFERKKDQEVWEYIRYAYYELKKEKTISNIDKFITLESYIKADLKWEINKKLR